VLLINVGQFRTQSASSSVDCKTVTQKLCFIFIFTTISKFNLIFRYCMQKK